MTLPFLFGVDGQGYMTFLIDIFLFTQEPVKKKVKTITVEKEREELPPSPTKQKNKKQSTTKKENQTEKSRLNGT